jgi:hypothetical protein
MYAQIFQGSDFQFWSFQPLNCKYFEKVFIMMQTLNLVLSDTTYETFRVVSVGCSSANV